MNKLFEEEIIPVMLGTKCSKCWVAINMGIFQTTLSNGKLIYFCERCHLETKLHPLNSKVSFKGKINV